ncbi:MAG: TIGR02710 family CRISPR-associated CARF protein [Firmicutes bacterium]|nr:TIGR02710 family CRISPR-associated CARF protein [Bacillota bacterium]
MDDTAEKKLEKKGVHWKNWPRTTEEERNKAEEYYLGEIMPLLIEVFVARERLKVKKRYDGMVLSLGTSFEPLVLSIMALNPDKVCFLCTEESRQYLDPVIHFTGLTPSKFEACMVDKDNPLQIYQAIKDIYKEWGRPANIVVDFTGGTKSMSGGSTMAGGLIGADMVYVASSNYLVSLRRPFPGSEHLEFIPNPYQVFGDLEEEKALGLMAQHDYSGASRIFTDLEKQVPDPRRYAVLFLLCRAYEAWDNLDIAEARENMALLVERVRQYATLQKHFILAEKLPILEFQLEALKTMEKYITGFRRDLKARNSCRNSDVLVEVFNQQDFVLALMFTLYCSARRRGSQGKYDMASLLLYRILELISQVRLAARGLDTVLPDYSVLDGKKLLSVLNSRYKKYKDAQPLNSLPQHINMFQGYMLLDAMGDELTQKINLDQIRGQVNSRNYNIFAHGFDFVNADACGKILKLVEGVMERFLAIWGKKLAELEEKYHYINP